MVVDQVAKAVKGAADKAGLLMPAPEAGSGYMVWRLPGEGWVSFKDLDDDAKQQVAETISGKIATLKQAIGRPDLADKIARMPDAKYVYTRRTNGRDEYALVAWAYRYPESRGGDELETWVNRVKKQHVSLGFAWDGALLPSQPFTIQSMAHKTMTDGKFEVGSVPVGKRYMIEHKPTKRVFTLDVEAGKDMYEYDLTIPFGVKAIVRKDGAAMGGASVSVSFDGRQATMVTDDDGMASMTLALAHDGFGNPTDPQPGCTATCADQSLTKTPVNASCELVFEFDITTPPEEPEPPVEEPEKPEEPEDPGFITIEITDVLGTPISDMPIMITLKKKGKVQLRTDADGMFEVPKEWLTPGEKMHVDFEMTPEYHDAHGIELDKKKRKKK